jgi:hypothetical protein
MSSARMSVLTWTLIFGGMLGIAVGWTVRRGDAVFGWVLVGASLTAVVTGIVLVWVRSRMAPEADE